MYEYARKVRQTRGMYGMGVDDVTPGMQLVLDYRAGAKTMSEAQSVCMGVAPARYHTDYDECRWFLTPEDLCRRENGRACTDEELRQQCFFTPANLRHNRCFFYMNEMTAEEAAASNAGPEVETSALQQAAGTIAEYRERVADAADRVVRTLRPVDADVQAIQNAVIAAGCTLPRYGADGRWGTETETGVRCLAEHRGWNTVVSQYPWIAQRIQVPTQTTQDVAQVTSKPSGGNVSVSQVALAVPPVTTSTVQTASIFSALTIPGLPTWAPWAMIGVGFVSVFAFGAYLIGRRG